MKNDKKIKLSKALLTKREQELLKGGADDNVNKELGCICTYTNQSFALVNNNSVADCRCLCSSDY